MKNKKLFLVPLVALSLAAVSCNKDVNANDDQQRPQDVIVEGKFTVTFESEGKTIHTFEVKDGMIISKPEGPIVEGKKFIGWFLEDGTEFDFNSSINRNVKLIAKYENETNPSGENQGGEQGENQGGEQGGNQGGEQGGNQGGEQGGNQGGEQGGNQGGEQGGNQGGEQGGNQGGEQGGQEGPVTPDENKVTVTFVTNQGDEYEPAYIEKGSEVTLPTPIEHAHYKFVGWYLDNEYKYEFENLPVDNSITIYGKYVLEQEAVDAPKVLENGKTDFHDQMSINGEYADGSQIDSIGTKHVLVIPVNLDSNNKTDQKLQDIKTAFMGTNEETGWYSVHSYYNEASFGKLDLQYDFTDWFTPSHDSKYYKDYKQTITDENGQEAGYITGENVILHEALAHFDSEIDYTKYNNNGDDNIDCVWLVYNIPYDTSEDALYWAFVTWNSDETQYDGLYSYCYGWASTEFMYDKEVNYNNEGVKVDAHTFIHESGHTLGLNDFYDTDPENGPTGGYYGADMMDYNMGDMSSIDKLMLNWVDPYVVTESKEVTIKSFGKTGDCILISANPINSIYNEYFLVELYTPDLRNSDEPIIKTKDGYGVRIIHVDARLNVSEDAGNTFICDNGSAEQLFIDTMKHTDDCVNDKGIATENILFKNDGIVFGKDVYSDYTLHDGTDLFFTLEVTNLTSEEATVKITFTQNNSEGHVGDLPIIED
jgi:M6 family metalloprotease-like protein